MTKEEKFICGAVIVLIVSLIPALLAMRRGMEEISDRGLRAVFTEMWEGDPNED